MQGMATQFDENILRSLRRISRAIDLYSRKLAGRYKLTGPQLVCLRQLAGAEEMTSGELAAEVALSQATVTGILDRLEARELIGRRRDSRDRRRVMVTITGAGRRLVESAPPPLHNVFSERLAGLPESDQADIDRVLARVVDMMEAEELDAAPLMTAGPTTAVAGEVVEFLTTEQNTAAAGSTEESKAKKGDKG